MFCRTMPPPPGWFVIIIGMPNGRLLGAMPIPPLPLAPVVLVVLFCACADAAIMPIICCIIMDAPAEPVGSTILPGMLPGVLVLPAPMAACWACCIIWSIC